jgi:hypothetical protein
VGRLRRVVGRRAGTQTRLRLLRDDSGSHECAAAAGCAFSEENLRGRQADRLGAAAEEVDADG